MKQKICTKKKKERISKLNKKKENESMSEK